MFWKIIKQKSTEEFSGFPYISTLLNCLFSAWYGLPFVSPNNLLVSTVNGTGAVLELCYVIVFLFYIRNKKYRRLVIKTKSVKYMPFFLSLFVFLCGTSWFIFGLLGNDPFVYIPNGVGSLLGAMQLILYAVYKEWRKKNAKTSSPPVQEDGKARVEHMTTLEMGSYGQTKADGPRH
eukprot:PITA_07438